jgi:uncharacterized membrane protein YhaH (DUF805 family)
MSKLNSKTLTIAAALLMVLALLVMATPLLRPTSGFSNRSGSTRQFTFQGTPGQNNSGQTFPSGQNGQTQVTPGFTTRQFQGRQSSILRLGFLSGVTGTIVYTVALILALVAAAGMFMTKRWGQVLGIIIAVVYGLLALASFVPMLLMGFMRLTNSLSLGLNILHLVLAVAVIVLALIPAKKVATPIAPVTPPAATA